MEYCISCGKKLTKNDVGFHKKMVNRGAVEFMCVSCLCEHFGLTEEKALEMIEIFKKSGCVLFD